ncbi:MAG: ribosomal protein L24E [Halorubrum sp. J07HR59]|nr:MAG: ribosomal protein L24E [Halorubrum sp. J07HR59]
MVEKRTCDYTGEDIEPGTGTMYVQVDGTVLHFKDSKAEKNFFMGREARDLEWTQAGQRAGPSSQNQSTPDPNEQAGADEETESSGDEASVTPMMPVTAVTRSE